MSKPNAAAAKKPNDPPAEPATGAEAVRQVMAEALPAVTALLAQEWRARESGVFFNVHEVVPKAGTPIDTLLRPEFWSNISQRLKPGDTIIAFPRDAAWYAELLVWDAGQNWAHVSSKGDMPRPSFAAAPGTVSDFEIKRDPIDGWCVTRTSTQAKVKGGFTNSEDARKWLIDHQRALRT